jgi:hypothetical protein
MVAYACNLSYSGGRDYKDWRLEAKCSQDPISTKRVDVVVAHTSQLCGRHK